ncbi:MAG TPA: class I SAM-dependent methyltransferase [Candidatus Paceibacterota bacterium]|nr:class I SAM-dependent methyltransferase [Candidatus Paceibacterota bacterium]HUD01778.1 class I SAM-dependent methyltransferase [Rhabdochlamydiaceae bacterium]
MKNPQKLTTAYYDENAEWWASRKNNSFIHESQFRKFTRYLKKGDSVLDIGCAYGIHVPLFLGIGRTLKYEGLDVSSSMLRLAKSRYPQLIFKRADIGDKKTLPKKKYDGFWAAAVLMHVPVEKWDDMFTNIERITKPHAIGYITIPKERPNPASKKDQRHFSLLSRTDFLKMISARGWKVLHSGEIDGSNAPKLWRWFILRIP